MAKLSFALHQTVQGGKAPQQAGNKKTPVAAEMPWQMGIEKIDTPFSRTRKSPYFENTGS